MLTMVRLARVTVLLTLVSVALSCISAIAGPTTGPWEKVTLTVLAVGLVWLAARVIDVADRVQAALRSRQSQ